MAGTPRQFGKVVLTSLNSAHLIHIIKWVNNPAVTQYFAGMQKRISQKEELAFIKRLIASPNDRVFSVFDDNEYIGQVSINQIHWPSGEGRLFMVVVKKHQGRGYGHKILKAVQDTAFRRLGLYRLYLIVRPDNKRGIQLYHRCGFRQEGYLYEKYRIGRKRMDMIQMAILKPWWRKWWK